MNSRVEFGPTISIRFYSFKIKCATRFLFQFYIWKYYKKKQKFNTLLIVIIVLLFTYTNQYNKIIIFSLFQQ